MKKNYGYKILILLIIKLTAIQCIAQQLPLTNFYWQNMLLVNPATAGLNGCTEGFLSNRKQWVGFDGSPATNMLTIQSPLKDNMGIGGIIIHDKAALLQRFSANLSFAYKINIQSQHTLSFGASGGFYQNKINLTNARVGDINDDILGTNPISGSSIYTDIGVQYIYNNRLRVGISTPQLPATDINYSINGSTGVYKLKPHVIGYAGYDIPINSIVISPSVLTRSVSNVFQYDANLNLLWKKQIWTNISYRSQTGLITALGVKIEDRLTIGYAYELWTSSTAARSNASHEVMLAVTFCKRKKEDIRVDTVNPVVPQSPITEKQDNLLPEVKEESESESVVEIETKKELVPEAEQEPPAQEKTTIPIEATYISDEGYYVVIESFLKPDLAQIAAQRNKEKNVMTIIAKDDKGKWYYVALSRHETLQPALEAMKEARAKGFKKAWVGVIK